MSGPASDPPSREREPLLPPNWEELAPLLDALIDAAPEQRAALIVELSAGDPARQRALADLVAESERAVPLFDRKAAERFHGLASPPPPAQLPEILADRYHVGRELGSGGMARVYLARDLKHGRDVAIKVLHADLSAVIGPERFLKEIELTAGLQHPHILPLFDSGTSDGLLYYVMPYVAGETLRERLKWERQLPVAEAVRIASAVADALDYAHKHGVIHRDIKPENILLHEGRPLVADFGIALAVQSAGTRRLTQPGRSLGTPEYMSPEQSTGEQEITGRSDIYALGAVTYEMLIGEPPFTGATAQQILSRARAEEPRALTAQRRHVAPNVEAAVLTALEKLPADRFESAGAFARALNDPGFRGAAALAARSERRGRRTLVAALGGLALALAAVAAWGWLRAAHAPADVVRFTMQLPRDLNLLPKSASVGSTIAVSPDGKSIVFVGTGGDGTRRLYARALDQVVPRELAGTEGGSEPFYSPDGRWIGFGSAGRLQKLAVDGGLPQTVVATDVGEATWTPQDVIVFAANGALYSLPSSGGTPTLLLAPDSAKGEGFGSPVALADGDHLLYSIARRGGLEGWTIGLASVAARSGKDLGIHGTKPLGVIDRSLIYARDNALIAVPLDVSAGRATGPAVTVATGVTVTSFGSMRAALSRSGTLAYLSGGHESRIVLTNGKDPVQVVLPDERAYGFPRFSPDGRRIAVGISADQGSDIWVYDLASLTRTRLSSGGSLNERPEWTPDGTRVLYRTDATPLSSIWWRPADLSGPAVPLIAGSQGFWEAVFTPDGRTIVVQADGDIAVRSPVGDSALRTIATGEIETSARVSPDGRWIAFVSGESGSEQVVVQPVPGPGTRTQVSSNGGTEPVWSRDGSRLFYRTNKKFMAATVTTAPTFAVRSRDVLFDDRFVPAAAPHANYDVSLDGKRLLVLEAVEAVEDAQLIVVVNWGAEVRARLRGRVTPK